MSIRIKKGDQVTVNTGKDKGKEGEVMMILGDKAVVKGVNLSKKHQKQDQKREERAKDESQGQGREARQTSEARTDIRGKNKDQGLSQT